MNLKFKKKTNKKNRENRYNEIENPKKKHKLDDRIIRVVYSGVAFGVHRLLPEDRHNYYNWNNEYC